MTDFHLTLTDLLNIFVESGGKEKFTIKSLTDKVETLSRLTFDAAEHKRAYLAVQRVVQKAKRDRVVWADLPRKFGDSSKVFYQKTVARSVGVVLSEEEEDSADEPGIRVQSQPHKKRRKHMLDMSRKQQYRLIDPVYQQFLDLAEKENVSAAWLGHLFLERACYRHERKELVGSFGTPAMHKGHASYIQQDLILGKEQWVRTKKNLAPFVTLPSWPDLRNYQIGFTPQFTHTIQPGKS